MRKFPLILSVLFVAMPIMASSVSVYDLGAGAQTLFSKVIGQYSTSSQINSEAMPAICYIPPARSLYLGSRGEDVRRLQEFLYGGGYLNVQSTGYFGPITKNALAKYQAEVGIAPAGVAGPKTREYFKSWCINQQLPLSAYPEAGPAPLNVAFQAFVSVTNPNFVADAGFYKIIFGDGEEQQIFCSVGEAVCPGPHTAWHTYRQEGTYIARLVHYGFFGDPQESINGVTVGRKIIRVGNFACTMEYAPVCASKPIVCITTPCNPIEQTYSNRCIALSNGASVLYEGQCRSSAKNLPPVISALSGPTNLAPEEVGTWSINANDPENGQLNYLITWGDEWVGSTPMSRVYSPSYATEQKTTFTHSYINPGTYTVRLTVRDNAGLEAQVSATVTVDSRVCTKEYVPVCGRPQGCSNPCPPGMYCAMLCRQYDPMTYPNRCVLNESGAEYLYEGLCR